MFLIPDRIGVSLEVHCAACVLPAFQNRHNGTAVVHPDAGRICNTASEAASAAILYRNTDRADGFACHPHRRDAFRLRRNTGHRLKAPQEQLSVASVLGVGCCVLCPAGGIGLRRSHYSTKPVPVKLIRALLCSAFIRPPNANNTASARSREAPCRLSAPSLSYLFSGIFFIVQQIGHIPQADAQRRPVVQQCRGGRWQYTRHAQRDQRQVEAHDKPVAAVDALH